MDKKTTTTRTKRKKTWGDDGFVGQVHYGCYTYKIVFTNTANIKNVVNLSPEMGKVYGAIACDSQQVAVGSNISEQLKRLTVWHELMHMILLNNNINDGGLQSKPDDETLTDTLASRIYELTRRNPELMRWLMK